MSAILGGPNRIDGRQGGGLFAPPPVTSRRRQRTVKFADIPESQDNVLHRRAITPLHRRHLKAREALAQLQGPITPEHRYTPEREKFLKENVKRLFEVANDLELVPQDDDSDAEYYLPSSFPSKGQKRKHTPEEEPDDAGWTRDRPPKRVKTRSPAGLQWAPSKPLSELKPQPLQFEFPEHPDKDRGNTWYQNEFRKLFSRLHAFAQEYFGLHDLNLEGEFHQPWAANMTPEFVSYVNMVAEADPEQGGWDELLRDTTQRQWLIVAILMRMLEVKIFSTDLWGAEKEEKKLLLGIERAFLNREGFQRTLLRSQTVRTIIGCRPLTKYFHEDTAKLTAKVALLLKPLTDFLYGLPPRENIALPTMEEQYQALHNIISSAAYLSICIRLSPSIFYMTDVEPDAVFDPEDQYCTEDGIYMASRDNIKARYESEKAGFIEKKKQLDKRMKQIMKLQKEDSKEARALTAEIEKHARSQPIPISRTHRALTKMGIWPNIRRYKPGSIEDEKKNEKLELRDGFRIHEITKSAVMCYYGTEKRENSDLARVDLEDLVLDKQKKYGTWKGHETNRVIYAAAAIVPFALAAYGIPCDWFATYPVLGGPAWKLVGGLKEEVIGAIGL